MSPEPGARRQGLRTSLTPWPLLRLLEPWGNETPWHNPQALHTSVLAPREVTRSERQWTVAGRAQRRPGCYPSVAVSARAAPSAVSAAMALLCWFPDHGVTKVSPDAMLEGTGVNALDSSKSRTVTKGVFQPPTSGNIENIRNEKTRNASL